MEGDYCLSCVDQIISVIGIAPPSTSLPLFVKHTPSGTVERQGNPPHPVWGKGREEHSD